jgi:hypothetical protein
MILAFWRTHPQPPLGTDQGLCNKVAAKRRGRRSRQRPGEGRRYFLYGVRPEPMPSFLGPLEGPYKGRLGICCSGGGIRSAAYNLGALQSLQEAGELERASYLAAVSGGSYIAAAFSMVAKTWPGGPNTCRPPSGAKGHDDSDPRAFDGCKPFAAGSPEEQYLRNRSSYIAPSGSEKLYLGFRVVIGLLFNLFFLSLPLFGLGLLLGEFLYRPFLPHLVGHCAKEGSTCHAEIPAGFWIPPLAVAALGVLLALLGLIRRSPTDRRAQFLQTWSTRLIVLGVAAAILLVAVPTLVEALHTKRTSGAPNPQVGAVGGATGLAGLLAGVVAYLRQTLASPKHAAQELGKVRKSLSSLTANFRRVLMYAAGALIGPLLLLGALVFGVSLALAKSDSHGIEWWVVVGAVATLALFGLLYLAADITSWSLHPFYKRRICTAFALKRVRSHELTEEERDRVQPAPPKAPAVEIGTALERDFDRLVELSDTALHGTRWPTLIVCAAANVSDPGATPPGRNVTSFTFSAYSIGGPLVGGARTKDFEKALSSGGPSLLTRIAAKLRGDPTPSRSRRARDLSLPAAVAMSGAAISPSMGKMTRRPLTFLLALANIRLGVWIPNPRWVMNTPRRKRRLYGRPRPWYVLLELIGRNRVNARYLYVTDGGHYENLGLVELLRRGCTEIYCFDASGGASFEELGDAIALARSELGVEVTIHIEELEPEEKTGAAKTDTVVASFTYQNGTTGKLLYARNVLTAEAPWDVQAYHRRDPSFPHNSTIDQLYTDQKFEAYRKLGELAGTHAIEKMLAGSAG